MVARSRILGSDARIRSRPVLLQAPETGDAGNTMFLYGFGFDIPAMDSPRSGRERQIHRTMPGWGKRQGAGLTQSLRPNTRRRHPGKGTAEMRSTGAGRLGMIKPLEPVDWPCHQSFDRAVD
jgi:hypothetical protein